MRNVTFKKANFSGAGVSFGDDSYESTNISLQDANLRGVKIYMSGSGMGTQVENADIRGADFTGATATKSTSDSSPLSGCFYDTRTKLPDLSNNVFLVVP